jgi:hypothetical protein
MAVSSDILGIVTASGVLVSSGGADEERKSCREMIGSACSVSLASEKGSRGSEGFIAASRLMHGFFFRGPGDF